MLANENTDIDRNEPQSGLVSVRLAGDVVIVLLLLLLLGIDDAAEEAVVEATDNVGVIMANAAAVAAVEGGTTVVAILDITLGCCIEGSNEADGNVDAETVTGDFRCISNDTFWLAAAAAAAAAADAIFDPLNIVVVNFEVPPLDATDVEVIMLLPLMVVVVVLLFTLLHFTKALLIGVIVAVERIDDKLCG